MTNTVMSSAQVRISEELKNELDDFLEQTSRYSTQAEFVSQGVRDLLDQERMKEKDFDEETLKAVKKYVEKELQD